MTAEPRGEASLLKRQEEKYFRQGKSKGKYQCQEKVRYERHGKEVGEVAMNTVAVVRKGATQDEDRECPVKTSPCLSKCNSYFWRLGFQGKTTATPPNPPYTHIHTGS